MRLVSAILRERIAHLGGVEFTQQDLLYDDGSIPDFFAFAKSAMFAITKMSYGEGREIDKLGTKRGPNGWRVAVYKERNLKTAHILEGKAARIASKNTGKSDIDNPWKTVYPDMFTVPKFKGVKPPRYKHCEIYTSHKP